MNRRSAMADTGEVLLVGREREEVRETVLPNQESEIPSLFGRPHEEVPSYADHHHGSARGFEKGKRMADVSVVRVPSGYRGRRSKFREVAVVSDFAKAKQVEHHDRAFDGSIDERPDVVG
jgi:hypothetical protein